MLIAGIVANLACGYAQGHYLTYLACLVPQQQRGRCFAFAYALGAAGTYFASSICGGLHSRGLVAAVGIAVGLTIALSYSAFPDFKAVIAPQSAPRMTDTGCFRRLFVQICTLVFLFSVLYKTSFYFSEIIYISGAAGILCVACFILLSFIIVYRAVSIADMSGSSLNLLPFAGMGLGVGRLGESLGTLVGYELGQRQVVLIIILSVLFIASVLVSFLVYQKVYTVTQSEQQREEAALSDFENRYALTSREKEIFRLTVAGKSNAELADTLYVSESTVKFHIGHILKKTKCANRSELIKKYCSGKNYIHSVLMDG